jgi:hypothetical protein
LSEGNSGHRDAQQQEYCSAHGTQYNPRVNWRNIPITLTDTALRNLSVWVNDQLMDEAVRLSAVNLKVTAS